MVKILQAHNFTKQNTFPLSGDIVAATLIDSNRIAVGSAEQFIEIYDISDSQQQPIITAENGQQCNETAIGAENEVTSKKYSLATVGEVVNLIYCEAGKYLLTLEKETAASPVHFSSLSNSISCTSNSSTVCADNETKMFVRIYANFSKFPESKLLGLPITIRIASMTTPKAPLLESLDVIELPLRSAPDIIQCCQTSGNIIVSSKDRIYLYEYTQCIHESTQPRFSYIDFLPFKFFVSLNFVPLQLKLAENVIACINNRFCVAFKIVDVMGGSTTCGVPLNCQDGYCADYDTAAAAGTAANEDIEDISSLDASIISKASVEPYSQNNSLETDSMETSSSLRLGSLVSFPGRTTVDFKMARLVNSACGKDFEVELKSQWDLAERAAAANCTDANAQLNGDCRAADMTTQEIIIKPVRANDIKIKLVNEAKALNVQRICSRSNIVSHNDDSTVQYDIRKLLQICIKTSDPNKRVVDILRCMDLKAIYLRDTNLKELQHLQDDNCADDMEMGNQQIPSAVTTSKHVNKRTLRSSIHYNCVGYALLVASSVDGYLYQFCAQGKWYNENEKPIATYSFTAPVIQVHIDDYVIYAVTTESVETHTSRIGHKLFNNRFEYPTIGSLFPEESSPDVNSPVAVIGLCSFINVQFVCMNRKNLVLISNSGAQADGTTTLKKQRAAAAGGGTVTSNGVVEQKRNLAVRLLAEAKAKHSSLLRNSQATQKYCASNEWTLYKLHVPKIEDIIEDLENIAESYHAASSVNFYDVMEEAHVMLRLSLSLYFENISVEREYQLRRRFEQNCRKLADFSIRSNKKEIYLQSAGFYKMCNMHLADIYGNYTRHFLMKPEMCNGKQLQTCAEDLIGLVYTVKQFLLNLGTDRLNATFLNQLVKPFFTPNRVIEQGFAQVPLSLEFLNMLIKLSPADIPQIMLQSPVVADAITVELINYLKYLEVLNSAENLLLAVTACRMSNFLLSQEVIAKTSRRDLAIALLNHKNVLFDDGTLLFRKKRHDTKYASDVAATQRYHQQQQQSQQTAATEQNFPTSSVVCFSDFTETILLATENAELLEAVSDVFVHALCIEHSISLDMLLQLFLNYIASHIGQKGYQSSQKVLVNILQVYFYDLFDVNASHNAANNLTLNATTPQQQLDDELDDVSSKLPSLNSERGGVVSNESLANSISESNSNSADSISLSGNQQQQQRLRQNCIVYNQRARLSNASLLQAAEQSQCNAIDYEANRKGLKILFRMYLGRLQALSELLTELQPADLEQQSSVSDEFLALRIECIKLMMRHLQEKRLQQQQLQQQLADCSPMHAAAMQNYYYPKCSYDYHTSMATTAPQKKLTYLPLIPDYKLPPAEFEAHMKSYIRPIPCLLARPQYLNRLPPFKRSDFSQPNMEEGETDVHFLGWHNELLTLTLKIQSLLAYQNIDREIIEEFIAFIQKTPQLIGVDSFLVIALPKNLAINYMLSFGPEYMWHYGKSNGFTPKHWESLLKKILNKQDALPNWKSYITEILNNLVVELTFEELLQCFPSEVVQNRQKDLLLKEYKQQYINCDSNVANDNAVDIKFNKQNQQQQQHQLCSAELKMNCDNATKLIRNHLPMDNIDESNVFHLILRKAVSKQRSIALHSMIESTGTQLFDATSNPMYNL